MKKQFGLLAKSVLFTVLVAVFFVIQGCAKSDFTPAGGGILAGPGGSSTSNGGDNGNDGIGGVPVNPTPTPSGGGGADALPKMSIEEPLCGPFMDCPAYFVLTAPAAKTLTFSWRTNDTLYTSNPARIGQPGIHYVSTSGLVSFAVGEQRKGIIIKSLNISSQLVIPFVYSNCVWGGVPVSCALLPL